MIHCENDALVSAARERLVHAARQRWRITVRLGRRLAEVEAANRALFLANRAGEQGGGVLGGPQVYVVHCSASGTVEQVALAAANGQRAIAETTVQYLTLDESVYIGERPETGIMQPPLREGNEKILLWKQVADGTVSTIGTDHCDYTISQNESTPSSPRHPAASPGSRRCCHCWRPKALLPVVSPGRGWLRCAAPIRRAFSGWGAKGA